MSSLNDIAHVCGDEIVDFPNEIRTVFDLSRSFGRREQGLLILSFSFRRRFMGRARVTGRFRRPSYYCGAFVVSVSRRTLCKGSTVRSSNHGDVIVVHMVALFARALGLESNTQAMFEHKVREETLCSHQNTYSDKDIPLESNRLENRANQEEKNPQPGVN